MGRCPTPSTRPTSEPRLRTLRHVCGAQATRLAVARVVMVAHLGLPCRVWPTGPTVRARVVCVCGPWCLPKSLTAGCFLCQVFLKRVRAHTCARAHCKIFE